MKVKDLIHDLIGINIKPTGEAEKEALERNVVVLDLDSDDFKTIEEVRYDGAENRLVIEVQEY